MADILSVAVEKRFAGGASVAAAFGVPEGALVTVLFGPSGSGKTTVLRSIAGLEQPERGAIRFGDETWVDTERGVMVEPQRRGIGFLFQDYALFPHLTVRRNIAYGIGHLGLAERETRLRELADLLGIGSLMGRYPGKLSGGERQRVALARTLAPRPRLLLLDEPLSALDAPARERLRRELRRLLLHVGIPAVVVTHDRTEALAFGDRLVVMDGGRVRQAGKVHEVFSRPADFSVAHIAGVETVLPATVVETTEGIARVRIGERELMAVAAGEVSGDVYACIRAEDVMLELGEAPLSSARNRIAARVQELSPEGPLIRVTLDCGFDLAALVTKQSAERLNLAEGVTVTAVVKAPSVHLVPRA
jgi:molybdate transport system ATP-binding protein